MATDSDLLIIMIALNVSAIILCGGRGTRSKNPSLAKSLQVIGGRPIIEWQIEDLQRSGIKKIVLSVGHLSEQIITWSAGYYWGSLEVVIVEDNELAGTSNAIFQAESFLQTDFTLIVLGDIFFYDDFNAEFDRVNSRLSLFPFVHPNNHPGTSDLVYQELDGGFRFIPKDDTRVDLSFRNSCLAGVLVVKTRFLKNHIFRYKDFERSLIEEAIDLDELFVIDTHKILKDSGTSKGLNHIQSMHDFGVFNNQRRKCIIVDLDDTLVPDSIGDKKSLTPKFYQDAIDFFRILNAMGILIIVVSNQPAVAKGQLEFEELHEYINSCERLLGNLGVFWDAFLFCPHHPDSGFEEEKVELKIDCSCRKPKSGLIENYFLKQGCALEIIRVFGDSLTDFHLSRNLGVPFTHVVRKHECLILDMHDACSSSLSTEGLW